MDHKKRMYDDQVSADIIDRRKQLDKEKWIKNLMTILGYSRKEAEKLHDKIYKNE